LTTDNASLIISDSKHPAQRQMHKITAKSGKTIFCVSQVILAGFGGRHYD